MSFTHNWPLSKKIKPEITNHLPQKKQSNNPKNNNKTPQKPPTKRPSPTKKPAKKA
jgi:hypothetical protein